MSLGVRLASGCARDGIWMPLGVILSSDWATLLDLVTLLGCCWETLLQDLNLIPLVGKSEVWLLVFLLLSSETCYKWKHIIVNSVQTIIYMASGIKKQVIPWKVGEMCTLVLSPAIKLSWPESPSSCSPLTPGSHCFLGGITLFDPPVPLAPMSTL
jgi:hypothetical protein